MRCDDARAALWGYLDGELAPADAAGLEQHLATCTSCPPLVGAVTGILGELRSLPETPFDPSWLSRTLDSATAASRPTNEPNPGA